MVGMSGCQDVTDRSCQQDGGLDVGDDGDKEGLRLSVFRKGRSLLASFPACMQEEG